MTPHRLTAAAIALFSLPALTLCAEASRAVMVKARLSPDSAYTEYPTRLLCHLQGFDFGARDSGFSKYGGLLSTKRKATGFFRVERVNGRWWLVDPEGHLTVFRGVSAVAPGTGPGSAAAYQRLYGNDTVWAESALALIGRYGFNSVGGWSSTGVLNASPHRVPYTLVFPFMSAYGKKRGGTLRVPGHTGYPNDLIFLFDTAFAPFCEERARELEKYRDDPYLLGYYSDNEPPVPVDALDRYLALDSSDQGYRAARAWFTARRGAGAGRSAITRDDREAFLAYMADTYYGTVAAAMRRHDPNHLYLGSRLNLLHLPAAFYRAAGKHIDVMSLNIYHMWAPHAVTLQKIARSSGRPILATEWYAKGDDSGLPNYSGAGWIVPTQSDRGMFYQHFALALLESRWVIGWKWFKYLDNDPAQEGAELSNIDANKGIVTVDYRPYVPLLDSMKALNERVHRLCAYFDTASSKSRGARQVSAACDSALTACPLTAAQSRQFSTADRAISPFWQTAWAGRDSLALTTGSHSMPGRDRWDHAGDAAMVVKAGWDAKGLCLMVRVSDDCFVPRGKPDDWATDMVELFLDPGPAGALDENSLVSIGNRWSLTTRSRQYQLRTDSTGGTASGLDTTLWEWRAAPLASTTGGAAISVELVRPDSLTRVLEVRVPWQALGHRSAPKAGTRLAFNCGYNDLDSASGAPACLRWTGNDPYSPPAARPWGAIVLSGKSK